MILKYYNLNHNMLNVEINSSLADVLIINPHHEKQVLQKRPGLVKTEIIVADS